MRARDAHVRDLALPITPAKLLAVADQARQTPNDHFAVDEIPGGYGRKALIAAASAAARAQHLHHEDLLAKKRQEGLELALKDLIDAAERTRGYANLCKAGLMADAIIQAAREDLAVKRSSQPAGRGRPSAPVKYAAAVAAASVFAEQTGHSGRRGSPGLKLLLAAVGRDLFSYVDKTGKLRIGTLTEESLRRLVEIKSPL